MAEHEHRGAETLSAQLAEIIHPQKIGIIVVDAMDAYFKSDAMLPQMVGSGTKRLQQTAQDIKLFLEASRQYPIATHVFTKMIERPDAMPDHYRFKMEMENTPPLVEVNGSGWSYYVVKPQSQDYEITKTHYNAFTDTNLHKHLQEKGVKSLVIVGGYGSRCVAATAIVASDVLGYNVFIPRDLIANLDSAEKPDPNWVDEIPAFLQAFDTVWGYTPSSQAILNTWKQLSKNPPQMK